MMQAAWTTSFPAFLAILLLTPLLCTAQAINGVGAGNRWELSLLCSLHVNNNLHACFAQWQESPEAIKSRLLEKYLSNQDLVR
jgi:hypothetical protein